MCLQCCCEAQNFGLVLKDYALMRSTKDHPEWPLGWWGLVDCNDPLFVWEACPLPDPCFDWDLDDDYVCEQINNFAKGPFQERSSEALNKACDMFDRTRLSPEAGYAIVSECMAAGYRPKKHGRVDVWLFDYIGRYLIRTGFKWQWHYE